MAKGDHVYVDCFFYDHHGIDCGDGTIIHFSGKRSRIVRELRSKFADGKPIKIKKDYEKKYSPDEIVKRAEKRLNEKNYDFFSNNCEHFAYYCTTGKSDSPQVRNARTDVVTSGVSVVAVALATTEVSAGGILGLLGFTTAAFPPLAVGVGAAALATAICTGLNALDNCD